MEPPAERDSRLRLSSSDRALRDAESARSLAAARAIADRRVPDPGASHVQRRMEVSLRKSK